MTPHSVSIPPFRLDHADKCLWHGRQRLALTPKDYAVLSCLVANAQRLVSHDALMRAGWPQEVVEPGTLKVRLRRLRQLLGDDAEQPRFIEAVRGHGYRFIGPVFNDAHAPRAALVGRGADLARLKAQLEAAVGGDRQMVFLTGEAGIGKTALLDAFMADVRAADLHDVRIAHGQCIEHHGVGEAYLPMLEALGRLCLADAGKELLPLLRRCAPTWLAQMPALIDPAELESLNFSVMGAAQQRMMREMAETLEAFTVERALVLCLEDLQWADYSTLDLIGYLAKRRGLARLLLVATCRDVEVQGDHPLLVMRNEMRGRRQIHEMPLRFLDEREVGDYLEQRFALGEGDGAPSMSLAGVVHRCTDGNPLFMVNMVEDLVSQAMLSEVSGEWRLQVPLMRLESFVPHGLLPLLERQFARLDAADLELLEAASVVGAEFSTAVLAACLERPESEVEARCEHLAQARRFLQAMPAVGLPNDAISARYRFAHALYQKVLYERQAAVRRARMHRHLGAWVETLYGARTAEIAAELAMHFEQGQDYARAVHHYGVAAHNALRRSANREAIDLINKGIALIAQLPPSLARAERELELQVMLAVPLMMTRGSTALEVRAAYRRARDLCGEVGDTPLLFPVLVGLGRFSYGWNLSDDSKALREQLLRIAKSAEDPAHLLIAMMMLSGNAFFQGRFERARSHAEQGLALYDPLRHRTLIYRYGDDPQVLCLCWRALADWYLGRADAARATIAEALRNAEALSHPYGVIFARFWSAFIHQGCGSPRIVKTHTEALLALTEVHENPQFAAMGRILHAWALAQEHLGTASAAQLRLGLDALRATRQELGRPYFLALLAEVHLMGGQRQAGLAVVDEALEIVANTGECMHEAELHRLRGELLLTGVDETGMASEAEACFDTAIAVARGQSARYLELRAVTSLARLHAAQPANAGSAGQGALRALLESFAEGTDTADYLGAAAHAHPSH